MPAADVLEMIEQSRQIVKQTQNPEVNFYQTKILRPLDISKYNSKDNIKTKTLFSIAECSYNRTDHIVITQKPVSSVKPLELPENAIKNQLLKDLFLSTRNLVSSVKIVNIFLIYPCLKGCTVKPQSEYFKNVRKFQLCQMFLLKFDPDNFDYFWFKMSGLDKFSSMVTFVQFCTLYSLRNCEYDYIAITSGQQNIQYYCGHLPGWKFYALLTDLTFIIKKYTANSYEIDGWFEIIDRIFLQNHDTFGNNIVDIQDNSVKKIIFPIAAEAYSITNELETYYWTVRTLPGLVIDLTIETKNGLCLSSILQGAPFLKHSLYSFICFKKSKYPQTFSVNDFEVGLVFVRKPHTNDKNNGCVVAVMEYQAYFNYGKTDVNIDKMFTGMSSEYNIQINNSLPLNLPHYYTYYTDTNNYIKTCGLFEYFNKPCNCSDCAVVYATVILKHSGYVMAACPYLGIYLYDG